MKCCYEMKMNYLLKNNQQSRGVRKPIIAVVVILAVAGFFYFFASNFASQSIYSIARPILSLRDYVFQKFADLWSVVSDKQSLARENVGLQRELDDARLSLLSLDVYKKENEDLKNLLGRSTTEKKILASVLEKPNRSLYDTLMIDAGENQGVKKGDFVFAADFIIGNVEEVHGSYSKVSLASTPGQTFTVRVGNSGIDTQALGQGGGNFVIKLPKEIPIKVGDLIKSSGLPARFFGTVQDVEQTETGSYQFVLFNLPVNINTLDRVLVLSGQ